MRRTVMRRNARREQAPERVATGAAARILGVTPRTLREWVDSGTVRAARSPTGRWLFEVAHLRQKLSEWEQSSHTAA